MSKQAEIVAGIEFEQWSGITIGFNDGKSVKGIMRLIDYSLEGDTYDFFQFERIEGAGKANTRKLGVTLFTYFVKDIRMISLCSLADESAYLESSIAPVARSASVEKWMATHVGTFTARPEE